VFGRRVYGQEGIIKKAEEMNEFDDSEEKHELEIATNKLRSFF